MGTRDDVTVLHVDDSTDFLDLAATYLERIDEDISVVTASSAAAGHDVLDERDVDCVVSDYQMPRTDGLEFLDEVRAEHPELPFVLFTGKGSEEIASDAISAGVTDYLQKESGTDQYRVLANRVRNAVEQYRAKDALAESKRRLQTLVDNLPGLVYRADIEAPWPMEFVGGRAESVTGYPASAFERGEVTFGDDLVVDEDAPRVEADVAEAVRNREPFEMTYRIRARGGDAERVWERGEPVFENGDAVALEGFVTSLTDRPWKTD